MGSTSVACGSGTDGAGGASNCCRCRECCNDGAVRAESFPAAPSSVRGGTVGGPVSIALLLNLVVDPNFDINELAHFKGPEPTSPRCMSDNKAIAKQQEHVPLLTILPQCCKFQHSAQIPHELSVFCSACRVPPTACCTAWGMGKPGRMGNRLRAGTTCRCLSQRRSVSICVVPSCHA